jgi:hypothetical protein
MRAYHYTDGFGVIRICAKRKPSELTKPKSGTWVVREYVKSKWVMPGFPEITWFMLTKLEYLGSTPISADFRASTPKAKPALNANVDTDRNEKETKTTTKEKK